MYRTQTDTAVVILSFNAFHWHEKFLPGILEEGRGHYDVVLVDNASIDGTGEKVRQTFPSVHVIRLEVNRGFTNGYIEGLRHIESKYYVLLSSDFEVTPGWFEPLHRLMETDPLVAAVQPKIRYWREKHMFEYAGAAGAFIDTLGYPFCRGRLFFTLEEDKGQYDDPCETFWASGGCIMLRSQLYHEFGGLDNHFYAHMEEIDLCWRFKNAGYKVMCEPRSLVYHVGGSVISYGSPEKIYHNYRNGLILLVKNLPAGQLAWKLPLRLILDGVAGLYALWRRKGWELKAILRAHRDFWKGLRRWFRLRRESRAFATRPNMKGMYPRSIVWDYFVRGRRIFSELKPF